MAVCIKEGRASKMVTSVMRQCAYFFSMPGLVKSGVISCDGTAHFTKRSQAGAQLWRRIASHQDQVQPIRVPVTHSLAFEATRSTGKALMISTMDAHSSYKVERPQIQSL